MPAISMESVLTCPECGTQTKETMPISTCQIAVQCLSCGGTMRARVGECCVFCSYGSVPCPSIQEESNRAAVHAAHP